MNVLVETIDGVLGEVVGGGEGEANLASYRADDDIVPLGFDQLRKSKAGVRVREKNIENCIGETHWATL